MLYLHCGWPHTGTSSFQAAMFEHRDLLAAAGVVYPERWQRRNAHHGILELCTPSTATEAMVEDFQDYLEANREKTVLISSELLTGALPPTEKRGSLLRLLAAARQVTSVTCLWTLRCMADVLVAQFHSGILIGRQRPRELALGTARWEAAPRYYSRWLGNLAGMCEVEDALGKAVVYGRYDSHGAHYDELLRGVGVADPQRSRILGALRGRARINARPTQKAAVALLHLEAISARAGVEIPRTSVVKAWHDGALRFDEDTPCALVGADVRHTAHRQALEVCRRVGFDPYIELFENVEFHPSAPMSLDPEVLTEADLERLVGLSPASVP